jgi:c-di-AMP phosphodiesterase-like protein
MHTTNTSFKGYSIVSCGTLSPELNYLKDTGFLDADRILYTKPGLHEVPDELEKQLKRQLDNAKKYSPRIIVVYGSKCYIGSKNPFRDIDKLIQENGAEVSRVKAKNCIDMLADIKEREKISQEQKIYWLSPGWLKYWKQIFKDWDVGKANETFPQNDRAILLDALGIYDEYSQNLPEKILEFSDWMAIPIEPYKISLGRLKKLLLECLN